ncbi:substrate-binding domain-containing protein [Streptomyces pathocidini]|uniref:LacI family DNA-binding transcriptional regulator n=1 Tax=Streptomyces pathocidini TaxID=1650571 RepID=UPI0033CA14DA
MLFAQRQEAILRAVRLHGAVRVTEIAERLDVSQMTVRRDINVLAEGGLVARVHGGATLPRAARQAPGRQPVVAHGHGERWTVGMVVPAASHYHREVIQGARSAAESMGARLSLGVSCYDLGEDRIQAERLLDSGVDGLLLTPSAPLGEAGPSLEWIAELPVPVTIVERRRDPRAGLDALDHVTSDHEQGALSAARHLAGLGHRRIALLATATPTTGWLARGLDTATEVFGLSREAPRVLDHVPGEARLLGSFLDEVIASEATAAIVHTDEQAVLLAETARTRGLRIPADLALVSYDDAFAALANVPLTAVAPPRHAVGRTAAALLVRRLQEGAAHVPPQQTLLAPRINIRASTTS